MKISKRILALLLAGVMVLSTACGKKGGEEEQPGGDEAGKELTYEEKSAKVYDNALGEFAEYYAAAKEAENVSEKHALMAIAEAKLLEANVMVPIYAAGGNYAISRIAPYTVPYTLWGGDMEKVYQQVIATEPIKTEDREAMKQKWTELKGTGTYLAWAVDFLEGKGYTLKDTHELAYTGDPETWDAHASYLAVVSENTVQTCDSLLEYDVEGTLQPSLATEMTVSDDGLTYTFKIREGVKWVDSQGREIGEVKADDWVAGLQHVLDACGGLEYLVQGVIVNASEYIDGDVTDFAEVGVKALDDYTLEYTLTAPCSYFTTMFGYSIFAPMSREYFVSQGGAFGEEYDDAAATYNYGKTPDNIAYCGAYLVTSFTPTNSIVYEANETYWNKDAVRIQKFTKLYNDGSEPTKLYTDTKAGTIDGAGLNNSCLELAKADGWFDQYGYVVTPDATTYTAFYNLNRSVWANASDATKAVSAQTDEMKEATNKALQNVHFRTALSFAFDRASYNAQSVGDDLKYASLRNTYTPGHLVSLEEEVTVDINGTATTFAAGTRFGAIVQAQLTADGFKATVWDPNGDGGAGTTDGFDGWYNPTEAAAELEIAIKELAEQGLEITAENPIHLDLPYNSSSETWTNKANTYKQSIEKALGGKVVIDIVACADSKEWYYTGYYTEYGYEQNYDIFDLSGWGPDYGDPSTFLDTFLGEWAGYCCKSIGIY